MSSFPTFSSEVGYTIRINSETQDNGLDKIAIEVNEHFLIITPKNEKAQKQFLNWYLKVYKSEIKIHAKLEKLNSLISNEKAFDILSNQKEAYAQTLWIRERGAREIIKNHPSSKYPPIPEKSFSLLKEWYFEILTIDKAEFLKNSMDDNHEIINTFEINLLSKMIESIDNKLKDTTSIIKKTTLEKTALQTFHKWLVERQDTLSKNKTYIENEDEAIAEIENWNKKTRTYLLLKLGIEQLPAFKQAGQKDKYLIIANILNCSPRKAREYYNHNEKELNSEQKESVLNFLNKITKK